MAEPILHRDPDAAAQTPHDLIIIGGGIHGAFAALEATRRGLRPLLLERDDFGGATSWHSMRILHGGLRYLQSLDVVRSLESAAEQAWYFRHYPELVRPLSCLMPLYGRGLKRPVAFRAALTLHALVRCLAVTRRGQHDPLPPGRVLSAREVATACPTIDTDGLRGGGLWHDGIITSSPRLLIELLRWACARGATVLNHVEATELIVESGAVAGVEAIDHLANTTHRFASTRVLNCAGPWSDELATRWDADARRLTRPSLAYQVLLDRPAPCEHALAITASRRGAPAWFLVPWHGRLMAGTVHVAADPDHPLEPIDAARTEALLAGLNEAMPGLHADAASVVRVLSGVLPASPSRPDEPSDRPVLHDHGAAGGPHGLVTAIGVKYTTARRTAERALRTLASDATAEDDHAFAASRPAPRFAGDEDHRLADALDRPDASRQLRRLCDEEAAVHLDDLLLRRLDWTPHPAEAMTTARAACRALGWSEPCSSRELARLADALDRLRPSQNPRHALADHSHDAPLAQTA